MMIVNIREAPRLILWLLTWILMSGAAIAL